MTGCVRDEVEVAVVVQHDQTVGFGCSCEDQVGYGCGSVRAEFDHLTLDIERTVDDLLVDTDSGHGIEHHSLSPVIVGALCAEKCFEHCDASHRHAPIEQHRLKPCADGRYVQASEGALVDEMGCHFSSTN
jgi:hypothetical protein